MIHSDDTEWWRNPVETKWYVAGDTIVGGRKCAVLREEIAATGEILREKVMCEKDGIISLPHYNYEISEYEFIPVLDFSVSVGERLNEYDSNGWIYSEDFFTVDNIKTEIIENVERKVIYLTKKNYAPFDKAVWIDGIGALGNMDMIVRIEPTGRSASEENVYFGLTEVWQGDKLIFSRENWERQMSGVEAVKAEPAVDADAPVYDLQGRQVKQLQPGRVYIQGSRKFRR